MSIRVLLVDDHALARTGFRMVLDTEPDIEVVGEAATGRQAIHSARRLAPDVVLMDVRMPELDGIAATREIAGDRDGAPRVLILTTFDLDEYVYDALAAGASGFLLKDVGPEQLTEAIRVVAGGEALLAPTVTRRLIDELVRGGRRRLARRRASTSSRRASSRCSSWSRRASPTRRSPSCSPSRRRRSRRTSPGCSRSSTCATVSRRSCSPTSPGWRAEPDSVGIARSSVHTKYVEGFSFQPICRSSGSFGRGGWGVARRCGQRRNLERRSVAARQREAGDPGECREVGAILSRERLFVFEAHAEDAQAAVAGGQRQERG